MTEQQGGVAQPPYPREPNVHSGGKQEPGSDRDLPPYEDRKKSGYTEEEERARQATDSLTSHEAGAREISDAEQEGLTDTDPRPSDPQGAGPSPSTSGESFAPASEDARRAERLDTGLSQGSSTGPDMHSGDQGG